MSQTQTYANHTRLDPAFHFTLMPILFGNLIYRIVEAVRHLNPDRLWAVVMAMALLLLAFIARTYALRVQDRVIRMEERIRIAAVGSPETLARMDEFTIKQFTALRFAPYAELGALAERALREQLTPKQIKQSILQWRPDTYRV